MSEGRKGSILAFLFLPQFGRCFEGLSLVMPIFMRTLAMIFVQSNLIPGNHIALSYGAKNVRKCSLSELIGDAWYTLRTTQATPYQWGMFISVLMMIGAIVTTAAGVVMRVFFGLGAVAQAQLFDHPFSPYGAGGKTDMDTMKARVENGISPEALFDNRVDTATLNTVAEGNVTDNAAASDWGLLMLDKIVRQGAVGSGGALQKALGDLLQLYSTSMMVVAAVMIFWLILTVVVDTAKTGTVGGGRHNMVWAPIRIITALGLLIPLGSSGFSSGQYLVMKVAEWGSNLGTRGWATYVESAMHGGNMIAPVTHKSVSSFVNTLTQAQVCSVAYNTYVYQSTSPPADSQLIRMKFIFAGDRKTVQIAYTNETDPNICGSVFVPMYDWENIKTIDDPIRDKIAQIQRKTKGDIWNAVIGTLETARKFACTFTARRISDGGSDRSPVVDVVNGRAIKRGYVVGCDDLAPYPKECDASPPVPSSNGPGKPATDPGMRCHRDMIKEFGTAVEQAGAETEGMLVDYVSNDKYNEMTRNGWPSMGVFFARLTSMNVVAQATRDPGVTYNPGKIMDAMYNCTALSAKMSDCDPSGIAYKTTQVMAEYDRWWQKNAVEEGGSSTGSSVSTKSGSAEATGGGAMEIEQDPWSALTSGWTALKAGGEEIWNIILRAIGLKIDKDFFIYTVIDLNAKEGPAQVYPLTQVAVVGHSILMFGFLMVAAITIIQILAGFAGTVGIAAAASSLFDMLSAIGYSMATLGMMLTFYVPLIPFIRVAFATLTWMVAVFEAVVMVPVAALAFLTTEGEGYAHGQGKMVFLVWLNVLMRPILTVIGFVGAVIIFNAFVILFHVSFSEAAVMIFEGNLNPLAGLAAKIIYTNIYVMTIYAAANSCFKLLELVPAAASKYLGGPRDDMLGSGEEAEQAFKGFNESFMGAAKTGAGGIGKAKSSYDQALYSEYERAMTDKGNWVKDGKDNLVQPSFKSWKQNKGKSGISGPP